jgi:hypothetical protein
MAIVFHSGSCCSWLMVAASHACSSSGDERSAWPSCACFALRKETGADGGWWCGLAVCFHYWKGSSWAL